PAKVERELLCTEGRPGEAQNEQTGWNAHRFAPRNVGSRETVPVTGPNLSRGAGFFARRSTGLEHVARSAFSTHLPGARACRHTGHSFQRNQPVYNALPFTQGSRNHARPAVSRDDK